jgi:hypothetical protein
MMGILTVQLVEEIKKSYSIWIDFLPPEVSALSLKIKWNQ